VHDSIINYLREAGGSTLLQQTISKLFEVEDNGRTTIYTPSNIPEEWNTAYNACPEQGHKFVSTLMRALAAEVILQLGSSNLLWRGVLPHPLIKMFHMGDIPLDQIRKLTRQIRTILHQGSKMIWKHRNKMNFAEKIEAERFLQQKEITNIRAHIESNEKAKLTEHTVEQVMDMSFDDRQHWLSSTKDKTSKQHGIDEIFPLIHVPLKLIPVTELPTLQELFIVNKRKSQKRQPKLTLPKLDKPTHTPVPGRLSQDEYKQMLKISGKRKKKAEQQYQSIVQKYSTQSDRIITRPKRKAASAQTNGPPSHRPSTTGTKKSRKTSSTSCKTPSQAHHQPRHTPDGGGSGISTSNSFQCLHTTDNGSYDEYINDVQQDSSSDSEDNRSTDSDDYVEETEVNDTNLTRNTPRPRPKKRKCTRKRKKQPLLTQINDTDSDEDMSMTQLLQWAQQQNDELSEEEEVNDTTHTKCNTQRSRPQKRKCNSKRKKQSHLAQLDDTDSDDDTLSIPPSNHTTTIPHSPQDQSDSSSETDEPQQFLRCNRKRKRTNPKDSPPLPPQHHPATITSTPPEPDTDVPIDRKCSPWKKKRK
jgi:hypothetical protein